MPYADDLILMATTGKELIEKIEAWKKDMESKGLRVKMPKQR